MADDRIFNFNGPAVFNDIHDNKDCTIIVPSPTDNTKKAAGQMATMATKPERKSSIVSVTKAKNANKARERMTLNKRGIVDAHIQLLYSELIESEWIEKDTKVDDFLDLFSGEFSDCRIIWSDKYGKSSLVYLFNILEMEGLVSFPKGYSLPKILMGHFVDRDGIFLTNLDKGDKPNEKAALEVEKFVDLLKQTVGNHGGRRSARIEHDEEDYGLGYGDALNENDIQSEGLSIHKR